MEVVRMVMRLDIARIYQALLGGTITFGSEDRKNCAGVFIWVPILPRSPWWLFNVDEFEMGGVSSGAAKAITDTGMLETTILKRRSQIH